MKTMKILCALLLVVNVFAFAGCSDDDDNGGTNPTPTPDPWIGTWLSEGANIAPILVALFDYDMVQVELNENGTVSLTTRVTGQAEVTITGTFAAIESASGNIHAIEIAYAAFSQGGIIEVTEGTPDTMRLEAVQTLPDIGATIPTVALGFGADATLGTTNIQVYERVATMAP